MGRGARARGQVEGDPIASDFLQAALESQLAEPFAAASLVSLSYPTLSTRKHHSSNLPPYGRGSAAKGLRGRFNRVIGKSPPAGAIAMVLVLLVTSMLSCKGFEDEAGVRPPPSPPSPRDECPKLDDVLYRMTEASEPARFAQEHDIFYRDGLVRVMLTLATSDAEIPAAYRLQVEARGQRLVQALVDLRQLCALSNDPAVQRINVPLEPRPMGR